MANKNDGRWIAAAIGATLFGLFHVWAVAAPLVSTWGHGEGQAFGVLLFDFPLDALMVLVPGGRHVRDTLSLSGYVLFYSIGGTIMYCCAGAIAGLVVRRATRAVRRLINL
jgi:hypothetical protein